MTCRGDGLRRDGTAGSNTYRLGDRHLREGSPDGGQSTVEFALVLPFVALLLMGVVQIGLLVHDQVLLTHAAREAARAAAVSADPASARRAAQAGGGLRKNQLVVTLSPRGAPGSFIEAKLSYTSRTDVPIIGPLLPDLRMQASAAMRVES